MIISLVIIILPWHLQQYWQHGDRFIQIYVRENIFQRAKFPLEFHFEGRLFYIKQLGREFFPWILVFLLSPVAIIFKNGHNLLSKKTINLLKKEELLIMLLLMTVIPLVSITQIATKIAWYAMPIYPFVAILLSYSINNFISKWKIRWISGIVILLLLIDAIRLMVTDSDFFRTNRIISSRQAVFIEANKQSDREIEYLVQFSERQGRGVLNSNLYTSTTWIYGGNPCARYYSRKKVNYYYSVDDFKKRLKKKGLFVVENGDQKIFKDYNVMEIYNNNEFTMVKIGNNY